jgi:hypothetical protein
LCQTLSAALLSAGEAGWHGELPASLSPARRAAKQEAIERGLSEYYVYVGAALQAFKGAMISRGRLCEMLLSNRPSPRADAWLLARKTYELLYRQST